MLVSGRRRGYLISCLRTAVTLLLVACTDRLASPPPIRAPVELRDLRVDSEPPGAEARAGAAACTTPCVLHVAPGSYRVRLQRTGYLPYEETVTVPFAGEARVTASLVGSH
jgi:hypothetical protein